MSLKKYWIYTKSSILDALKKIDDNKHGFLIVIDNDNRVVGTITDGDIRRELISGKFLDTEISYKKNFEKLLVGDEFGVICNKFKSEKISFLPIVDEDEKLVNVLTKKIFHTLLLHDIKWDLTKDFSNINENAIDFEIFNRPWGFYKSTLISNFVQSKIITIFPKSELSLQKHRRREEHWVIIKGRGKIILGESHIEAYPGKYIYIPKGCKHQIINDSNENIIFSEVQLGDYFGEDDIIRYADKYGRLKKKEKNGI